MNAGNNMKTPKDWRKGQTVYNFLEWVRREKKIDSSRSVLMADPFYIEDADWDKWWDEYNKLMKTKNI